METQPKTPKKRGEIENLQISSPKIQIKDLSEKKISAKKNYPEINKTDPPNQKSETLTGQKSPTKNLQR